MTTRTLVKRFAATGLAAGLGMLGATGVSAASPSASPSPSPQANDAARLAQIKAKANDAVNERDATLVKDLSEANGNAYLTSGDKSTLVNLITSDQSGLKAVNAKVQADTSVVQAMADAETIVTGFRVYVLLGPQLEMTIAADAESSALTQESGLEATIQQLINNSGAPAGQKAAAQAAYNDYVSQVGKGQVAIFGVSGATLAVTPAQYNSNHSVLQSTLGVEKSVRGNIGQARDDLQTIVKDLNVH